MPDGNYIVEVVNANAMYRWKLNTSGLGQAIRLDDPHMQHTHQILDIVVSNDSNMAVTSVQVTSEYYMRLNNGAFLGKL